MGWYRVFFFKQKTAYEVRISDWSSDVCSSDLIAGRSEASAAIPAALADTVTAPMPRADDTAVASRDVPGPAMTTVEIPDGPPDSRQIGRASCRERVCQYV